MGSSLILSPSCRDNCYYATMWSAAALANLAANYCDTDKGHCHYDWDLDNEEIPYLAPIEESPIIIDNEKIREKIIYTPGVVDRLIKLTCSGPVTQMHEQGNYPWPTRAEIEISAEGFEFPTIVPWAAAGALRNLVLSPRYPDSMLEDVTCLCNFISSPDWLEYEKADDTLYRLGLLAEEYCPLPFDENCQDLEGWESKDGNNCVKYEVNALCIEFGDVLDKEGLISANKACCICGGGEIEGVDYEDATDSEFGIDSEF